MSKDLAGKLAVITGANTGIGKETALGLAKQGAEVILACRSEEKTQPVIDEIKRVTGNQHIYFQSLDLSSLKQVKEAASSVLASERPIHLLINNAGLAGNKGLTQDGFELTFGVNHLGHFLWTNLLLDQVKKAEQARIVNVASEAHYGAKPFDWDALKQPTQSTTGFPEYQRSKLANVLHAKSLAKRLKGTNVTSYALHPGVVASDVWREVPAPIRWIMKKFMISTEKGAATTLYCATNEQVANESGRYYDNCKEKTPSELALDDSLAETLWQQSEEWTKLA